MEWQILAFVVAPAGSEIDPAVAQKIQRCPLLCDPDRVVQRQHGHGRREADAVGASRDVREDQIGGGENPERVEMVLADPGRMHADLLGVERFRGDVLDELVSRALVVLIVIIAQGEISKIHFRLLLAERLSAAWSLLVNDRLDNATIVNIIILDGGKTSGTATGRRSRAVLRQTVLGTEF